MKGKCSEVKTRLGSEEDFLGIFHRLLPSRLPWVGSHNNHLLAQILSLLKNPGIMNRSGVKIAGSPMEGSLLYQVRAVSVIEKHLLLTELELNGKNKSEKNSDQK